MSYENRQVPEGINVSREHPLREFFWLSAATIGILVVLIVVISLSAELIAPYIPFDVEHGAGKAIAEKLVDANLDDPRHQEIESYLNSLAGRLAVAQGLPDGIKLTVHYVDSDIVNAMATLGGHIVIYRGLLEKMPHENALSMVIAHEIAHIKHRDPLVALGRGVSVLVLLSTLSGFSDAGLLDGLVGQAGVITTLKFNRDQERSADADAVATLKRYYGHLYGADALFEIIAAEGGEGESFEFLRSHPLSDARIQRIKRFQTELDGKEVKTPIELPKVIQELGSRNRGAESS